MNLTARERRILKLARSLLKTPYGHRCATGDVQRGYGATEGKREAGERLLKLFPKAALKLK